MPYAALFQQFIGPLECAFRLAALDRHELCRQGLDHGNHGLTVIGEGADHIGIGGVDDQRGLTFPAALKQIDKLEPGTGQACRLAVRGVHRT